MLEIASSKELKVYLSGLSNLVTKYTRMTLRQTDEVLDIIMVRTLSKTLQYLESQ